MLQSDWADREEPDLRGGWVAAIAVMLVGVVAVTAFGLGKVHGWW